MHPSRPVRRWVAPAVAVVAVLGVAACSSDDAGSGSDASTTTVAFAGASPTQVVAPTVEGKGINRPQPAVPAPDGYVEEEFFIGGAATSFDAVDTPTDGRWTAAPGKEADYMTRVIVRRPPAERFSGTVLVEWLNVSAVESSPDWAYLNEEAAAEGHAYIQVSAQAQGVEGGDTLLDVEVDPDAAAEAGAADAADASGLKNIDPERYGTLSHPGDAYAFDIFSQVGRAVAESPELLGGLEPTQVIAMGESQSAYFLSTLVNAVHPLDPVFDGFLIHSRGGDVAPLDGDLSGRDDEDSADRAVLIRTDLDQPVMIVEAETDLTLLGYHVARQPDTDSVRTWEMAGTAHSDAHVLRSIIGGPRSAAVGSLIGCTEPINTGPHHEVLSAALHHLVAWSAGGEPPPEGERIELTEDDEPAIVRDELQVAVGGVRNPLVDVPVAVPTGDPPAGTTLEDLREGGDICLLFGTTIPLTADALVEKYGSADAYVQAFRASAAEAVAAGFLLQRDADQLIAEAESNRALFG